MYRNAARKGPHHGLGSVHEILVKIDLLCSSGDMLAD